MTTVTTERKGIPLSWIILGLIAVLAVGLSIYRLVVGLGPTTNLNDHYPWGLWITLDVFLIPIGAFVFKERITLRAVVGTLVALGGVAVLFLV